MDCGHMVFRAGILVWAVHVLVATRRLWAVPAGPWQAWGWYYDLWCVYALARHQISTYYHPQ